MSELLLTAGDDLVERIAHESDPMRAIVELVWNAVDAEATHVTVELDRDGMNAIVAVRVCDDGHGISPDEVAATFGRIGDSLKKLSQRSKNGKRLLHGKLGQGRLRAFALGSRVTWISESDDAVGVRQQVIIKGERGNRRVFLWEAHPSTANRTGTTVTANNDEQRSLRAHFAPILMNETDLTITFDGVTLDPTHEVLQDTCRSVCFGDDIHAECTVRIIEWRSGRHRALYFGPDETHFLHEEPGSEIEAIFPFSAYVTWKHLADPERLSALALGDMAQAPISHLWRTVRQAVREHFAVRRREHRREQIEQWKDAGIYPYRGEPASESERAERAVFDIVSGALVSQIPRRKHSARLTLELLRAAVRHDPEQLSVILHEVVSLSEADRATLTRLLSETTLSAIIRSANVVASRRKFLVGLEHLLFDPTDSGQVDERKHLHKILDRELWVFGESYHLMSSERSLTEMLRTSLRLEGLSAKGVEPVTRWDGRAGRTDLHLAALCREHDRVRHIVVELKAPGVMVGQSELNQVAGYANAVRRNDAFRSDRAEWDFILVATGYDDMVEDSIFGASELGLFLGPEPKPGRPRVRAYVRRWRDVIDENRRRLDFLASALDHDPSIGEGLDYLREQYQDLLPRSIAIGRQATPAEDGGRQSVR